MRPGPAHSVVLIGRRIRHISSLNHRLHQLPSGIWYSEWESPHNPRYSWLNAFPFDLHHPPNIVMEWLGLGLFGPNICIFVSTERNDQTEQEERREIKQRLNRKVGGCSFLQFHPFNLKFGRHTSPHRGLSSSPNRTLIPDLLCFLLILNFYHQMIWRLSAWISGWADSYLYFPAEPAADSGRAARQKDPHSLQWLCGSGQSSGLRQASWQALDQTVSCWQGS